MRRDEMPAGANREHFLGDTEVFTVLSVYHDRETLELITPFNPSFVDAIKMQIPAACRRWRPETKARVVSAPYDTVAARILQFYFPHAQLGEKPVSQRTSSQPSPCQCDVDHRALFVCQSAREAFIRAAYCPLSKLNHPDASGDHERMQRLNGAYARLTQGARS